jgi:glycosyltransferase involved in cell wall biosynthesis
MSKLPSYVLITPARDEADFIELVVQSVVAQTVKPLKWIVVSDGSTDGTDAIVGRYVTEHPWIELVQMPNRRDRHFAGKVGAFNAGYARLSGMQCEVIASLDGDISFGDDYFEYLLGKLAEDRSLGVVGSAFRAKNASNKAYDYRFVGTDHVSGACQVFRRECFEEIGGYVPVKDGGIDSIAVLTARMKGWKTRTFTEKVCVHHRDIGTAQHGALAAKFRHGKKDYALGGHPLWELCRSAHQMTHEPVIIGGAAIALGYFWAMIRNSERPVSRELIAFRRREQMTRLKGFLTGSKTKYAQVSEQRGATSPE